MIRKSILAVAFIMMPFAAFAQNQEGKAAADNKGGLAKFPVQSIRPYEFDVKHYTMSRAYEVHGRGEILNVEFELHNNTDDPRELYIYTIATNELHRPHQSTFDQILTEDEKQVMRVFVPCPIAAEDKKAEHRNMKNENFIFTLGEGENQHKTLMKYPVDPKLGVNPLDGKAYRLVDNLIVKTQHLSKYRKNYFFFNTLTLLIFDKNKLTDEHGRIWPVYRQVYKIEGLRR